MNIPDDFISEEELAELERLASQKEDDVANDSAVLSVEERQQMRSVLQQLSVFYLQESDHPVSDAGSDVTHRIGRYEVKELVGSGGFAMVYQGWDPDNQRQVAIKVPLPRSLTSEPLLNNFMEEALSNQRLHHPHIVEILDVGQDGHIPFIVFAYCEGPTLEEWLEENGRLPVEQAILVAAQLASGLAHSHEQGVLHRDIKPSNVLLFPSDDAPPEFPFIPELADYGLGKVLEDAAIESRTSVLFGTPQYLAPEQVRGEASDDPRVDIFGLGCILHEMASGQPPFGRGSVFEVLMAIESGNVAPIEPQVKELPSGFTEVLSNCLAANPRDRYDSVSSLEADLQRLLRNEPVLARKPTPLRKIVHWAESQSRIAAASSVIHYANLMLLTWILLYSLSVFLGLKYAESVSVADLCTTVPSMLVLHGVLLGLSFGISKHQRWAAGFSLLLSTSTLALTLCILFDTTAAPFPNLYSNPATRGVVYVLLSSIFCLLSFSSGVAWIALSKLQNKRLFEL